MTDTSTNASSFADKIGYDKKGRLKSMRCHDKDCIHYDADYATCCKHEWIEIQDGRCIFKTLKEDKDGYTGHDFARNFYTDAFFARSDARYDAATPCGNGRVVKYVPENKSLVEAARQVVSMFTYGTGLVDYLRMNQKGAIDRLIKALAKEDK